MNQNIKIDSVFEEKLCICGHYSVAKFTDITDTFIKYKNMLVALHEIIKETLNFDPLNESSCTEICEDCKIKLQDFYNFKIRTLANRKIFENGETIKNTKINEYEKLMVDEELLKNIKDYISKFSIKSIVIDDDSKNLIIVPAKCVEENVETQSIVDNTIKELDKVDEEPEYLEEFLDDTVDSNDEITLNEVIECTNDTSEYNTFKDNPNSRKRKEEEWACNKRKKLRNLGKSYINSKGKVVNEKKMLESCAASKCRNNCESRLSEHDRLTNFNHFWKLGSVVQQRKFIYDHILLRTPSRRRKSTKSNRSVTLQFYLDVSDGNGCKKILVCKKMFKNTLVVSNQVIQGVVSKYAKSGFEDVRGKHERKLSESQKLARDHVQKFPFFYVEQNMTKVQLYNMYVDECNEKGLDPVKESNYRELFDKFNDTSFLKTGKYSCEKCFEYNKATNDQRLLMHEEQIKHLEENKRCKDRALGRIRYRRSAEKRKLEAIIRE